MIRGQDEAVAIVGYGGVFPGASGPEHFWSNIERAADATGEVPPGRWILDVDRAFDPRIPQPDKVYSTRGGFCPEVRPEGALLGLEAGLLDRLDPAFSLAIHAAQAAWSSSRTEQLDHSRVGVIFGHIVLPTEKSSSFAREIFGRGIDEALKTAGDRTVITDPLNAFPAGLPALLVARALRLGGPAYTLDAACASTLYALKLAADALLDGRADAMISGGVSRPDPLYTQMGFSQLRALSARGKPAPFDELGDGLVVGEGAGLFVLKRLGDALRHGDTIHAVIRGIGLSNDIHGDLLAPSSEGQLRALRAAYAQAGWSPLDVDLIECHATGTPVGDAVEVESLKQLWGEAGTGWSTGQCVIGSVKSNVGHMLTAAGAAGLLKLLLAFKHQVRPPTANQTRPAPRLGLDGSPFRIARSPEPWPSRAAGRPRRAALSGFGFGGINAHVLLEEWNGDLTADDARARAKLNQYQATSVPAGSAIPVALVGLAAHFGGCTDLGSFQERVLGFAPRNSVPPEGHKLGPFPLRLDRIRIPPRELGEVLPQQSLMLKVAGEAVDDAGWTAELAPRTAVVVGLGLDQNTNNYQLRWWLSSMVPRWNQTPGLGLSEAEQDAWVEELHASVGPPLSANRTMGSLGGLVASRVARQFRIGGPSFSVSCDEGSGIEALRLAAGWLQRGEIDAAIVGAVDLAGDRRTVLARHVIGLSGEPGEGAVAVVLKRLDDAVQQGDRIYAIVPPETLDPHGRPEFAASDLAVEGRAMLEQTRRAIGDAGAAIGLAAVVGAATRLHFQVHGPESGSPSGVQPLRPWLRNREDGPRRTAVSVTALGGTEHDLVLEEFEPDLGSLHASKIEFARAPVPRRAALFVLEAEDPGELERRAEELIALASGPGSSPIDAMARQWWARRKTDHRLTLGMAVVASSSESLIRGAAMIQAAIREPGEPGLRMLERDGATIIPPGTRFADGSRLAFVYPGLGNVFPGMGRELGLHFPEILRGQDARNRRLRDHYVPEVLWAAGLPPRFEDHRTPILGQVAVGSLVTEILGLLGVHPDAAIGYSMGESAALVALGAWSNRDELAARLRTSPLFATELAGPCHAARKAWRLADREPVDWVAGIVPTSASRVEAAIEGLSRVHVLIKNTADETVIGGQRGAVLAVAESLGCPFLELPTVSTVHCPIGAVVEPEYHALHDLPTLTPEGITFYSGVWGRAYRPDRRLAADAITSQATGVIDFPAVVEQAYADGVRIFLEVGPGGSCSRLVDRILGDRPHLAISACLPERDELRTLLEVIAWLVACRVPVNLEPLYGGRSEAESHPQRSEGRPGGERTLTIEPVGMPAASRIAIPRRNQPVQPTTARPAAILSTRSRDEVSMPHTQSPLTRQVLQTESARAAAHGEYLRVAQNLSGLMARNLEAQFSLIESLRSFPHEGTAVERSEAVVETVGRWPAHGPPFCLSREQCLEFAVGSIAAVLGPEYGPIDENPTRVRLPDEPLMLVDRIVAIEGQPRLLGKGRVVTEHDIHDGAWYLDSGRIPPCIAIESGQADLFLSGYLGIDFVTRGLAVYRLLDATVTFHRGLPGPGEVILYEIRITRFFRQGDTHLFRFEFDGSVGGEPLLTMRDGCAGFFTADELAAGQGVVPRPLDARPKRGVRPADWTDLTPMAALSLDQRQLEALRRGALGEAFGEPFNQLDLPSPLPLPGGRMTLVHRVETLDPTGGRYGLGLIRAEAEIHPDDWFMVCHFVDDRVMPGTLMYECCLHTLRIFLTRLGWVGSRDRVAFEPLPGVANRLRCRGQVIESTRKVTYEVVIKELGYGPEPFAIADALMYADGKPIVEISDMALRLSGTNREELERLWRAARAPAAGRDEPARPSVLYGKEQILAFATGKPSAGFGNRYKPFDADRFIARLPAPPYSFLDRITAVDGTPWEMAAGTSARAEYDIPEGAWYFEADRQDHVPYAVLLETALQACGWTSAYMGSALQSDGPLKFRNLGGSASQHARVGRRSGTLETRVTATKVTRSAGMIIQHYEFTVRAAAGLVFEGQTYFGFFHPDALAEQVGIRDAAEYVLTKAEAAQARSFALPDRGPFPDQRWRMLEDVDALVLDGGPHGLGIIEGSTVVNPDAWFFKAHFLGDPVWPGSLGLESFLQLLKVVASERWGGGQDARFESPGLGDPHRWVYRGQILPTNRRVTVQAVITSLDEERRWIKADGHLSVDDRIIYQIGDFTLRLGTD
jgi:acyl transferase domain-containing protein/3-hydroxymyristoyl/3-hydroxydecanoyl-(acyl carrier protein) dehydratase